MLRRGRRWRGARRSGPWGLPSWDYARAGGSWRVTVPRSGCRTARRGGLGRAIAIGRGRGVHRIRRRGGRGLLLLLRGSGGRRLRGRLLGGVGRPFFLVFLVGFLDLFWVMCFMCSMFLRGFILLGCWDITSYDI